MIWLLFYFSVPERAGQERSIVCRIGPLTGVPDRAAHGGTSAALGDVHDRRPVVDDGTAHGVTGMASDLQRASVTPEVCGPRLTTGHNRRGGHSETPWELPSSALSF